MGRSSDSLFLLIKSLESQEKRYFKIFSSRHTIGEKNNYLKLFDAIDKQEEYDEVELKKKLSKEKFIKQLFVIKSYLFDMILKSLDAYHAENSIEIQLRQMIHYIEILYNKALYDECGKMIEKAEKRAMKYELHAVLLDVIQWKFKLGKVSSNSGTFEKDLDELENRKQEIIRKISNYHQYHWLNAKLFTKTNRKGWFPRSPEEIRDEYDPIIGHPIFENENNALSFHARMLYHNTISVYYHLKGDTEKSYSHSKGAENIFSTQPALKENLQEDYISCLSNLVFTSMFLGKYQETFYYINQLKELKPRSNALKARVITSAYLPEIVSYNINSNLEKGLALIPEIEAKISAYKNLIPQREILQMQYNFACLYFKAMEYKKASHWLFTILNNNEMNALPDLHTKARILNLLVQSESDKADLLPYTLRSTYRFLLKQQRLYQFEKKVIDFIRHLPDVSANDLPTEYTKLKIELTELSKNPYEKKAMDFFGFISWVERKIGQG